jgi:hypothetical protein
VVAERSLDGTRSLYPEDEAAGLMHSGYVRISAELTVVDSIAEIRRQAEHVEMIYYAYVLRRNALSSSSVSLSFRELIFRRALPKNSAWLLRTDYVFVPEDEDKEAVAQATYQTSSCSRFPYSTPIAACWSSSAAPTLPKKSPSRPPAKHPEIRRYGSPGIALTLEVTFGQM